MRKADEQICLPIIRVEKHASRVCVSFEKPLSAKALNKSIGDHPDGFKFASTNGTQAIVAVKSYRNQNFFEITGESELVDNSDNSVILRYVPMKTDGDEVLEAKILSFSACTEEGVNQDVLSAAIEEIHSSL